VSARRGLVLAILLYVGLDLSLAAMPGAFVFEASDSVETVQLSRARAAIDLAVEPAPSPASRTALIALDAAPRPAPRPEATPPARRDDRSRRAAAEAPPASEDPH
jgi:hypothetical protein